MINEIRILLVEDSYVLAERLAEVIGQIPNVILVATVDTELAAISAIRRQRVDLLILDLHLKQGTGFGVMRALGNTASKPSIVVLTNYDLAEYKFAARALGAEYVLDKALDYDRLPEIIHDQFAARNRVTRREFPPSTTH